MSDAHSDKTAAAKSPKTARCAHPSKDDKWRSFPKVSGLLQLHGHIFRTGERRRQAESQKSRTGQFHNTLRRLGFQARRLERPTFPQAEGLAYTSPGRLPGKRPGPRIASLGCRPSACLIAVRTRRAATHVPPFARTIVCIRYIRMNRTFSAQPGFATG